MKVFYAETHHEHNPPFEIFDGGEKVPSFEVPERAERVLAALKQTAWAEILAPADFGLDPILAVHDAGYVDFLRTAFDEWKRECTPYMRTALLPATFPPRGQNHKPGSLLGRVGYYVSDLSAPITAGTYAAALAAANCAIHGAEALLGGQQAVFALCRPPGHHAGKTNAAGYCYLNNAAIAAQRLSGHEKVAILDIDYHAGNGTQDIFYERADVLTISIHADPDFEYPYFCGYANETGKGVGAGFHHNYPLPAGTETGAYLAVLGQALDAVKAFGAQFLVVSAGLDLFSGDPLGEFRIKRDGISCIGQEIARLSLPTLVVMEGGYNNAALGKNFVALLEPFHK